jgi:hypothetical protein
MKNFTLVIATMLCMSLTLTAQIRISQVYGGGGNSGSIYNNDFVELFNTGATPVTMTNWMLIYASATGNFAAPSGSNSITLNATIPAGGYYLVQLAAGTTASPGPLPTPDATNGLITMGSTSGKLALLNNNTGLPVAPCPITNSNIVDFVGYGIANCFEGTAAVAILSSSTAAIRKSFGCQDTDINSADFDVLAPAPRNSSTTVALCTPASTNKLSLQAKKVNNQQVALTVNINNPALGANFILQRSTDGVNFNTVNTQTNNATASQVTLVFNDNYTITQKVYYRIAYSNGTTIYSNIAFVVADDKSYALNVWPNPAKNNLQIQSGSELIKQVVVRAANGSLVYQQQGLQNNLVNLNVSKWATGMYYIQTTVGDKIINSPFIKE